MTRPCILCFGTERHGGDSPLRRLRERFSDTCDVQDGAGAESAWDRLGENDLILVIFGEENAVVDRLPQGPGQILSLLVTSSDSLAERTGFDRVVPDSCEDETLALAVENLLLQRELSRRSREEQQKLDLKEQHLRALADGGVAMNASFDLDHILSEIHRSVRRLAGEIPVDIFYAGCGAIHSQPRWLPSDHGLMSPSERVSILEQTAAIRDQEEGASEAGVFGADVLGLLGDDSRSCLPMVYKNEFLGLILWEAKNDWPGLSGLLALVAIQAATALRNIHLTQERIHFERFSAFGRMIGSLVHDFRSPLTALRGYAGMLASPELDQPEREAYSSHLIEESDRLNRMISELLEFTRGGYPELAPRWIPLGDYLPELEQRIRAQFGEGNIRVVLSLGYQGPIYLDKERMDRALWNIISNACQSMNGDGTLHIRTEKRAAQVVLELEDEGCGIPEGIRHRIFEPFFSYGKSEGIGLGMAITKKIVEEHGGEIQLTSRTGIGTSIRLLFPMDPAIAKPELAVTAERA